MYFVGWIKNRNDKYDVYGRLISQNCDTGYLKIFKILISY